MWKITRKVTKETKGDNSVVSVYDAYLNDLQKTILMLVFSIAHLVKITPKQLAKAFVKSKADEYAKKFNEELAAVEIKADADLEKALNRSKRKGS